MSADNMVYLQQGKDGKWRAWHGFASDDGDLTAPATGLIAETDSRSEAIVTAHDWSKEHYTEYGVVEIDPVSEPRDLCTEGVRAGLTQSIKGAAMSLDGMPDLPKPLIEYQATFATIIGYTAEQVREVLFEQRENLARILERYAQDGSDLSLSDVAGLIRGHWEAKP